MKLSFHIDFVKGWVNSRISLISLWNSSSTPMMTKQIHSLKKKALLKAFKQVKTNIDSTFEKNLQTWQN